jgi:hypothetical protein
MKSSSLNISMFSTYILFRYRFGLIDILQTWNMRKRAENIAKVTMMGVDPNAVSSINPKKYADRMTAFFDTHTI